MSIYLNGAELKGKPELKAQFEALAKNASGHDLAMALWAGGLPILNEAKRLVPKDTRTLARSLHEEFGAIGENNAEVLIGSDVVYAAIQEFGGFVVAKKKPYLVFQTKDGSWHSVRSVYIPPQPYLRPALDTKRDEAMRTIEAALMQLRK